jgi:hypothetical protein
MKIRNIPIYWTNGTNPTEYPFYLMTIRSWITLRNISANSSDIQPTPSSSSVQTLPPFPVTDGDKKVLQGMIVEAIEQSYAFMVKDIVFINATWLSFGDNSQGPLVAVLLFETNVNVSNYCFDNEAFTVIREEIDQNLINKTHFLSNQTLLNESLSISVKLSTALITSTFSQLMRVVTIPTNSTYCDAFRLAPSPSPTVAPTFPPRFSNANSNQNNVNTFSQLASHPDISLALILVIVLFVIGSLIYMLVSNRDKPLISNDFTAKVMHFMSPNDQLSSDHDAHVEPVDTAASLGKEKYRLSEVLAAEDAHQYFATSARVTPSSSSMRMTMAMNPLDDRYLVPTENSDSQEMLHAAGSVSFDPATYYNTYHNQLYPGQQYPQQTGLAFDPAAHQFQPQIPPYYPTDQLAPFDHPDNYSFDYQNHPTYQQQDHQYFPPYGQQFDPYTFNEFDWTANQRYPQQQSVVPPRGDPSIVNKYKPIFPKGFGGPVNYRGEETPQASDSVRYIIPEQSATSITSGSSPDAITIQRQRSFFENGSSTNSVVDGDEHGDRPSFSEHRELVESFFMARSDIVSTLPNTDPRNR